MRDPDQARRSSRPGRALGLLLALLFGIFATAGATPRDAEGEQAPVGGEQDSEQDGDDLAHAPLTPAHARTRRVAHGGARQRRHATPRAPLHLAPSVAPPLHRALPRPRRSLPDDDDDALAAG